MACLVICPTCGGKMSSNARECPHCGENDFLRPRMERTTEECRYRDPANYALGCEGKGFLCRNQIWGNYGLHTLQELQALGIHPSKGVAIGKGLYVTTDDEALRRRIAEAAARNDLYLKSEGRFQHDLYLNKVRCPRCKGTGRVVAERPTGDYEDIRKRV